MKYTRFMAMLVLTMSFGLAISSCGDDQDDENYSNSEVVNNDPVSILVGTWTGVDAYGFQCRYTFKADGTGSAIMSNSEVTNKWTFTYVIEGNRIKCGGMNYYSGLGESGESYVSMTFFLNGNTLSDERNSTFRKQ